jgi:hypothetical protein
MTEELKIKVRLDTSELKNGVKQIKDTLKNTNSEFGNIDKATANTANSTKAVTTAMGAMGAATVAQTAIMAKALQKPVVATRRMLAPINSYVKQLKDSISGAFSALGKDFDAAGDNKVKAWLGALKTSLKDIGESAALVGKRIKQNLDDKLKDIGTNLKNNFSHIRNSILGVVASITALTAAMLHLSESTKEYRQAMSQLNTSFIALGSNAELAGAAYEAFYRILGDVQRSTEAANLLAQITTEEKDLVTWTKIATGAMAMFPDSLPTESLIEAANETIKTAKVTGALADALNWPADGANKISKALEGSSEAQSIFNKAIAQGMTTEDAFNEVLKETNSETQREVILRSALNGVYAQSAGLYEEMNKELIKQNEAQNRLNQMMAKLGQITQPVQTAFTNFKATLAEALAPAIKVVCDWLVTLINWLTTAAAWLGAFLAVIFPGAAEKISNAFNSAASSVNKTTSGTTGLKEGLEESEKTAQKLRRTLMGFDELNVVSTMDSGSGSSASGGTDTSGGNGIDVSGLDTGDSVFKKAQEQMNEYKEKVKAFLDEFKTEIALVASALGLWTVAGLLDDFGKLIGLGDKFHGIMTNIKKLAATAITIVLQYSLVNEFMDNYIDGEGFKEYLKGLLVAAIGTGVLYAMWGPAGLMIGLAVTAVASIKAVIDNGGITNLESAVVGFTGLAAAIGAFHVAWSKLGLAKLVGDFGAFIALLKEGAGLGPALAAAFPKLSTALASVGSALSGFAASIGGVFGLTGGAAIAAGCAVIVAAIAGIVSIIVFLKNNWDETTAAMRRFFEENIAPKLDNIKESFKRMGEALGPVGEFIGDIIKKIGEWFASIEWLDAIGAAFEWLGGALVGIIGGVIAGAIQAFVSLFEGAVQSLEGVIQFITSFVDIFVKLFTGDFQGAWDAVKSCIDGIVKVITGLPGRVIDAIVEFVKGFIDWCVYLWDELVGHSVIPDLMDDIVQCFKELPERVFKWVKELAEGIIKRLTDMWNNLIQGCKNKLGEAKTAVTNGWNNIKSWFTSNVAPKFTLNYWKNKFDTLRSAASTKISEVKTAFSNGWNTIKTWFSTNVSSKFTVSYWSGKFNTIKDGAKSAFNGIISVVERAINSIIRKINTLSWKIPDWVPGIGGDTFGFNFREVYIPRLANGGIAVGSTLANIGERGKEAVLPLENNTQWMDRLADRIASRNSNPTKVVLKVGERELGYAVIDAINQNTRQTGGLKLQLV